MVDQEVKNDINHLEGSTTRDAEVEAFDLKGQEQHVQDSDAKNYVDPTIVITEEENTQLRRKIHRR